MTDDKKTIKELKEQVKDFVKERDWEKFHNPKDLSMSIAIESAELMEIFQWKGYDDIEEDLEKQKINEKIRPFLPAKRKAGIGGIYQ